MCVFTPGASENYVLVFGFGRFKGIECGRVWSPIRLTLCIPGVASVILHKVFVDDAAEYMFLGMLNIREYFILSLAHG